MDVCVSRADTSLHDLIDWQQRVQVYGYLAMIDVCTVHTVAVSDLT